MTELFEMIDDLRELQKLYAMGDVCYIDFQEMISKYEIRVEEFEKDMQEFAYDGC